VPTHSTTRKKGPYELQLAGQFSVNVVRSGADQSQEFKRRTQWIHDGQQGTESQTEEFRKFGEVAHGAQQHSICSPSDWLDGVCL
jgi:hypothetical protein